MDTIVWILVVAAAAGIAWALGANRTRSRYREILEDLAEALKWGDELPSRGTDLPGVGVVRAAAREAGRGTGSKASGPEGDRAPARPGAAGETAAPERTTPAREAVIHSALDRMHSYLQEGVEQPLRTSLEGDGDALRGGVQDALVAVEDLYFYLREVPEDRSTEDLNELAREAADEYRREWGADVDVHVPERPTKVSVNREAMLDALYLVLHNAGAFGQEGEIGVVVRYQDGDCWLVIRDEGEGFGDEALDRAFEPFYTTSSLGLGLGLYHVKKIVKAMDGTVAVRNRRRGGGQVEIVLPEAEREGEE